MNNNFNLDMLQKWAEAVEPVFIVGPERSGTSMMFRTVVSHPSFCSFDNATVETFAFIRPDALLKVASPENYELRVYLGKCYEDFQAAASALIELGESCDFRGLPVSYLNKNKIDRSEIWKNRGYRNLLRMFFYFSWLNLGEKRLAEKTPAHIRCINELFDCFPKAKVLVCLRDPVEIIASHRKRLAKEIELGKKVSDPSLGWLSKSSEEYIHYFGLLEKKITQARRLHSRQVMCVSYGVVTTNKAYLHDVFNFLGEEHIASNDEGATAPAWDELLASSLPQNNMIDVESWVSREEVALIKAECNFDGWV